MQLKNIEIDFAIYKTIETERSSFEETPNDILRRLLKIPPAQKKVSQTKENTSGQAGWFGKGVLLPHATLLRAEYNGHIYEGEIRNGRWFVQGHYFTSPSGALGGVARTKRGTKTQLDGWLYWQVKRPGDSSWRKLDSLRA